MRTELYDEVAAVNLMIGRKMLQRDMLAADIELLIVERDRLLAERAMATALCGTGVTATSIEVVA